MAHGETKALRRPKRLCNGQSAGKSLVSLLIRKKGILFWQSQLDNIKELYYDKKLSSTQIAEIYGVDPSTITSNMKKLGLSPRVIGTLERLNAKYEVDSSYFQKIDSREKAYILGFILSDGHVSKKNKLMFCVHEKDADIIYKIRHELKSTHPIKKIRDKYVGMIITSKILCDSLRNIGLTNHKTFDFDAERLFSSIPETYKSDFIRGIFDGDGSICIYKYPYFKKHSFHFGITGLKTTVDYVNCELCLHTKYVDEGKGIYT